MSQGSSVRQCLSSRHHWGSYHPVLAQYLYLRALVAGVQLEVAHSDRLIWAWSASCAYFSASAYNVLFAGQTALQGAKEL
jgi:hypothetical protein